MYPTVNPTRCRSFAPSRVTWETYPVCSWTYGSSASPCSGCESMELLVPTAGDTAATLHPRRRQTADPFYYPTNILSFKKSHSIPSGNSFPKLTASARAAAICARASADDFLTPLAASATAAPPLLTRWMVVMEKPPNAEAASRADIVDYYVQTLARVLPRHVFSPFNERCRFFCSLVICESMIICLWQWKRCSDVHLQCILGEGILLLLWHRRGFFSRACPYVFRTRSWFCS